MWLEFRRVLGRSTALYGMKYYDRDKDKMKEINLRKIQKNMAFALFWKLIRCTFLNQTFMQDVYMTV